MPANKKGNIQSDIKNLLKYCIYASIKDFQDNGKIVFDESIFKKYDIKNHKVSTDKKYKDVFTMKPEITKIIDYIIKKCRDNMEDEDCPYYNTVINTEECKFNENLESVLDGNMFKSYLKAESVEAENEDYIDDADIEEVAKKLFTLFKKIAQGIATRIYMSKCSLDAKLFVSIMVPLFNLNIAEINDIFADNKIEIKEYKPRVTQKKQKSRKEEEEKKDVVEEEIEEDVQEEILDD